MLPSESEIVALREIWGRTGGRTRLWRDDAGWKPMPPAKTTTTPGEPPPERTAAKLSEIALLCGDRLQYKPRHGVLWRKGRVVKLDLHANGLEGDLPPQFGALRECKLLCLFGNALAGGLQQARLSASLTHLDLSHNKLVGPVPQHLGELVRLRKLHLEHNQLSGELPGEALALLVELRELTANDNSIEGPVPFQLGKCARLEILKLHNNPLTGQVPEQLADCRELHTALLANTHITGEIPKALKDRDCNIQIGPGPPQEARGNEPPAEGASG